jgi:hypothetical protein
MRNERRWIIYDGRRRLSPLFFDGPRDSVPYCEEAS